MKKIPLKNRKKKIIAYAIIDDYFYDMISVYNWNIDIHSDGNKYVVSKDKLGKKIYLHRLIMGSPFGKYIDHINMDGLDNRIKNLRVSTNSQNQMNISKKSNNKSGFKGISWFKRDRKWVVKISIDRKQIHGGYFVYIKDAIIRYKELSKEIHKNFSRNS